MTARAVETCQGTYKFYQHNLLIKDDPQFSNIDILADETHSPYCFRVHAKDTREYLLYIRDRGHQKKGDCLVMEENGQHPMTKLEFDAVYSALLPRYKEAVSQAQFTGDQAKICDNILEFGRLFLNFGQVPHVYFDALNKPVYILMRGEVEDTGSYSLLLAEPCALKVMYDWHAIKNDIPMTGTEFQKVKTRLLGMLDRMAEKYQMTAESRTHIEKAMDRLQEQFNRTVSHLIVKPVFNQKNESYAAPEVLTAKNVVLVDGTRRYYCLGYPPVFYVENEEGKVQDMDQATSCRFEELLRACNRPDLETYVTSAFKSYQAAKDLQKNMANLKV